MLVNWWKKKASEIIGLEIGLENIKILKINPSFTPPRVEYFATLDTPVGALAKNEIKNPLATATLLKDMLKRSNLTTNQVAVAIPRSLAILKNITLDKRLSASEMESRVWIEAAKHFPDLVGNIYLDFAVLGPSSEDNALLDVIIVACRKEQVKIYLELLQAAGLQAKIVDINCYALERALSLVLAQLPPLETVALLNLDLTLSSLVVSHQSNLIYAQDQAFDGKRLLSHIKSFLVDKGGIASLEDKDYLTILRESLMLHLRHAANFFYSSRPNIVIQKIVVAGECALIPELDIFIQNEIGIDALFANPFINLEIAPTVNQQQLSACAPKLMLSCGLALSRMS